MPQSFDSLGAFAAHLRHLIAGAEAVERRAVDKGSEELLTAVKEVIGVYQTDPVVWPALAESTVDERVRQGFTPDEPLKRSGQYADSFEREVKDHRHAVVGTHDERAAALEYGYKRIPARPAVGAAVAQKGEGIAHGMGLTIIHYVAGRHVAS